MNTVRALQSLQGINPLDSIVPVECTTDPDPVIA